MSNSAGPVLFVRLGVFRTGLAAAGGGANGRAAVRLGAHGKFGVDGTEGDEPTLKSANRSPTEEVDVVDLAGCLGAAAALSPNISRSEPLLAYAVVCLVLIPLNLSLVFAACN